MASCDASFVDHYAALGEGLGPDSSPEELKKTYFEMLRQFHPDKRPGSAGGTGQETTQSLNNAYELLRDYAKREAYDATWRRHKESQQPLQKRADALRRRGNELYSKAREMGRGADQLQSFSAVHQSLKIYNAAIQEYSQAIDLTPTDHRLFSNRALCYLAVEDWARCRDDSCRCTRLRPDFMKGWFLLVKAIWQQGLQAEARKELLSGLEAIPGCRDLLELQAQLFPGTAGVAVPSTPALGPRYSERSVSPAVTPPASRAPTPTRGFGSTALPQVGPRPVSPSVAAAGASVLRQSSASPGPASQTLGPSRKAHSSRSPAASSRLLAPPVSGKGPVPSLSLDGSMTCPTGNFGCPTPAFAAGGGTLNSQAPWGFDSSFPANVQSMWANSVGPSGNTRQSYSPGPSARSSQTLGQAVQSYAGASPQDFTSYRTSSKSPGPASARSTATAPGPDLGGPPTSSTGSRNASPAFRKAPSLRSAAESSRAFGLESSFGPARS